MVTPGIWNLLIVALAGGAWRVDCARVAICTVGLAHGGKAVQTSSTPHQVVLSAYDLQCRCSRSCDKTGGSIWGRQKCEMVKASSVQNDDRASCQPGETAYKEHCEALVQGMVTQYDVRCDPSLEGVVTREGKTKLPQGVGRELQTNKLTFDQCVAKVLRLSSNHPDFQKEVQTMTSSSETVPIQVGDLVINMPKCRCKKQWSSQALSREEASDESWQGPGCSRTCKPKRDRCVQPDLKALSNAKCRGEVKQYCANPGPNGMCTQSWPCEHEGQCSEDERVQTKTIMMSENDFLGQCHTCCTVKYPTGKKIEGRRHVSCGSSPTSKKTWIKEGGLCQAGMPKKKSGHNGHGRCSWSGRAKKDNEKSKSACSSYYGFGAYYDEEDDYEYRDEDLSDQC